VHLRPANCIVDAFGVKIIAALPGFHALNGVENTGSFAGKGKLAYYQVFPDASDAIITVMINLGTTEVRTDDMHFAVEQFVCQLFSPKRSVANLHESQCLLFEKKQARLDRLPTMHSALYQGILLTHYQLMVYGTMTV